MQQVTLQLGPLKVENLTQRTIALLGGKGTGKTTLLKMINYQLSQDYPKLPLYIFDPLNVMYIQGFHRATVSTTSKTKGKEFAQVLNKTTDHRLIIALKDMVQEEQAEFINSFFSAWQVHDSLISVDEISDLLPEGGQSGSFCTELYRAIKHWRNRNDGFIFATQRPADLSKKALELADGLNINRMSGSRDRDAARRYMEGNMNKDQVEGVLGEIQHMDFLESYYLDFRIPTKNPGVQLNKKVEEAVSDTVGVPVKNPFNSAGEAGTKVGKEIRRKAGLDK